MTKGDAFTNEAGGTAEDAVKRAGYEVVRRQLVPDDASVIRRAVEDFMAGGEDVLLMTGGTGVSRNDVTIETVRPFFEKELDGFGEALRTKSWDEVGAAAMLTRATAGVARGRVLVCMPGSPDAVRKSLEILLGELPHIVSVARS